ncbi:MAG TPA: DUF692 family protein [Cytophagales bacterium]|nr:DUF692 family protein [Cytophagales bacterium]
MSKIYSSISCNLDQDILLASLPLLSESRVEAMEWSVDALYKHKKIPDWFLALLQEFSRANRLIGHGIFYSIFSGRWTSSQRKWLNNLEKLSSEFHFNHISEHFGFMTGEDFHSGAPLDVPYTEATLRIGRDRLARIFQACKCPVGLENLAFSYSLDQVKAQGEFLEKLVEPMNGFIILDLHNLYCQTHNFSLDFDKLLNLFPLDRVREIHISGGSWADSRIAPEIKIRRDTHDNRVPEEVFTMLRAAIASCPQLKFVVLEQLGGGLKSEQSRLDFYNDFVKLQDILKSNESINTPSNSFLPTEAAFSDTVEQDEGLYQQQVQLSRILETAKNYDEAMTLLQHSSLVNSEWKIEKWAPHMIETAISIAQKWMKKPSSQ